MTRIKAADKIEMENMLKSHLNPELGDKIMGSIVESIAHHWLQEGRKQEKAVMVKKMQEEKITMAKEMLKQGLLLESVITITKLSKTDLEK